MLKVAFLLKRRKIGYQLENSLFPESDFYFFIKIFTTPVKKIINTYNNISKDLKVLK